MTKTMGTALPNHFKLLFLSIVLTLLLGACATDGQISSDAILEFPSRAGPPPSDWSSNHFDRKAYQVTAETGQRISYVQTGDPGGQRVIFLHGSPGFAGDWLPAMAIGAKGLEFVAPDRPGFGYSGPYKAEPSLTKQADALAPLLDAPNKQPVILVGWSFGAPVAAKLAALYPEKTAALVLVAGSLDPELEKVRFIQHLGNLPPFRYFVEDNWRIANEELIPLKGELERLEPQLAHVTAPVYIIHGENDSLVPIANVDYMSKHFTNAANIDILRLPNMGHAIPYRATHHVMNKIFEIAQNPCRFEGKLSDRGYSMNTKCDADDGIIINSRAYAKRYRDAKAAREKQAADETASSK